MHATCFTMHATFFAVHVTYFTRHVDRAYASSGKRNRILLHLPAKQAGYNAIIILDYSNVPPCSWR